MTRPNPDQPVQPAIVPPDVVELVLRVGAVRSRDMIQYQLEAYSATDGVLLGMESFPGRRLSSMHGQLNEVCTRFIDFAQDHVVPF